MTGFKDRYAIPNLGVGLGLRSPHYADLLKQPQGVDWLEIISENFMLDGGKGLHYLDQFLEKYTIVPHGVSLSIGNSDPEINKDYLSKLKALINKLDPPWFSDHLCWAGHGGAHMHNLLPLPYTEETADFIAEKIRIIQDYIERPFIVENLSSYVEFNQSTLTEWEFITYIIEKADCGLLLDVNNVYVSAKNHNFDPMDYINGVPKDRVVQYHIAGHTDKGNYIVDTHDHDIRDEVWDLFSQTVPIFGDVSVMIERDDDIPPFADLFAELNKARTLYETATILS